MNKRIIALTCLLFISLAAAGAIEHHSPSPGSSADETSSYIAALATYVEDKLVGDSELARVITACEQGAIANPFSRDEAELDTNKWHAYETLQEWIGAGQLVAAKVCHWVRTTQGNQSKDERERAETRKDTALIFKVEHHQKLLGVGDGVTCVVQQDRVPMCWRMKEGMPETWGERDLKMWPQASVDAPTNIGPVQAISVREESVCTIKVDGYVECWGELRRPQTRELGIVRGISVGSNHHLCVIKHDYTLACLGSNYPGATAIPAHLQNATVSTVESGWSASCAIEADGELSCFGNLIAPQGVGRLKSFAFEPSYGGCGIGIDNRIECWGEYTTPSWPDTPKVKMLTLFGGSAFAVLEDGTVRRWGNRTPITSHNIPDNLTQVRELASGIWHGCAVFMNNTLRCWGFGGVELSVDPNLRVFDGGQQ